MNRLDTNKHTHAVSVISPQCSDTHLEFSTNVGFVERYKGKNYTNSSLELKSTASLNQLDNLNKYIAVLQLCVGGINQYQ